MKKIIFLIIALMMQQGSMVFPRGHMKKVVLIGDSIRMKYQKTVQQGLEGKAIVVGPKENCSHTGKIIANMDKWILSQKPDIVHINAGLHEIYRSKKTGEKTKTIEEYEKNLRIIFKTLQENKIKVIWATSTPFLEDVYQKNKGYKARVLKDIIEYNKASLKIAKEFNLQIDDLYEAGKKIQKKEYYGSDGLHFNDAGSKIIGEAVIKAISDNL